MGHYTCICSWRPKSHDLKYWERPFIGAFTDSGEAMHVVKFDHSGDTLPGYHVPNSRAARSSYGGLECENETYEVLIESHDSEFTWLPESYGRIVHGAVQGGKTVSGEVLYIGRARVDGCWRLGKIHRSHGCCYFCLDGKEHKNVFYEVLACNLIRHYQARCEASTYEHYDSDVSYEHDGDYGDDEDDMYDGF